MANLSREETLLVDITIYNLAMEIQWEKKRASYSLSGSLTVCEYCGRKHSICCICDTAVKRWDDMTQEIKDVRLEVSEQSGITVAIYQTTKG
jgi:hypothetical protein